MAIENSASNDFLSTFVDSTQNICYLAAKQYGKENIYNSMLKKLFISTYVWACIQWVCKKMKSDKILNFQFH